jgi:hypothetical protein
MSKSLSSAPPSSSLAATDRRPVRRLGSASFLRSPHHQEPMCRCDRGALSVGDSEAEAERFFGRLQFFDFFRPRDLRTISLCCAWRDLAPRPRFLPAPYSHSVGTTAELRWPHLILEAKPVNGDAEPELVEQLDLRCGHLGHAVRIASAVVLRTGTDRGVPHELVRSLLMYAVDGHEM